MVVESLLRVDVTSAIKKAVRDHGKNYEPPAALQALRMLRIRQSTIAAAFQVVPQMQVKSYQVSEWLRGTAPCPEKYHAPLAQILKLAVNEANRLLSEAKQAGLYPLTAIEAYKVNVREAEALLQGLNSRQGRLV